MKSRKFFINHICSFTRNALLVLASFLVVQGVSPAQSARVAEKSTEISVDPATKTVTLGFRLVDAANVIAASALPDGGATELPTKWTAWIDGASQPCA